MPAMQLFVYEFLTGGGTLAKTDWGVPSGSMLREGTAMLRAIAQDFIRIPNVGVSVLHDARLPSLDIHGCEIHSVSNVAEETATFLALIHQSHAVVIIAPEIDRILTERCRLVEQSPDKLIGPGSPFVDIASDKHATHRVLSRANVPVPKQWLLSGSSNMPRLNGPVVVKARMGAGSNGVFRIDHPDQLNDRFPPDGSWCVEQFCPGRHASVAFLCGKDGMVPLPACWQHLSDDGCFTYHGGSTIMEDELVERCVRLGLAALSALPPVSGYVGIDIVLGDRVDGRADFVIEVNPRLTTSYVGLRAMTDENLAEAMLQIARGRAWPRPKFHKSKVSFLADGTVDRHSSDMDRG
jgi:hypothetical protein